jgi:ubiquinone/menaquinone biosynthesis C-methylase UbiE
VIINSVEVYMAKTKPFDDHSDRYEGWFKTNAFAYKSELNAVRAQMPSSGQGVEIGVGSGLFAAPLGIQFGLEPSKKMREIACQRGVEAIDGVAEALPYDDFQFDFALMVTTICFLDDTEAAVKEAYRVLKPGG